MPTPRTPMRPRELRVVIVILEVALVGIIVSLASGHPAFAGLFGGLAGVSASMFIFKALMRND
jgi:hypothetical protein